VKALRTWLGIDAEGEAGLSIIEIMVAMMVFAIIAVGVAFALTTSIKMTRDARSREVAANLAAQAIDLSRSIDDVFGIVNDTKSFTVDGVNFSVARSSGWVTAAGGDNACGTAGSPLQYKHVNVQVTWGGMNETTPPVQADTLIAPNGRINDPSMGTILVSVTGATGEGIPGMVVSAAPAAVNPNGAQPVDPAPLPTDADGCSYVLKVAPGNYDITIAGPSGSYVSEDQAGTVTRTVGVAAGDSTSADAQFDLASTINATFASNSAIPDIQFPSNLDASFLSENGVNRQAVSVPPSKVVSTQVHPFAGGYTVLAGAYVAPVGTADSCLSPDPAAWSTPNAAGVVGRRQPAVASVPGGSAAVNVPMGVVTVNKLKKKDYITAVSVEGDSSTGDPGCAVEMTYTFPLEVVGDNSPVAIALPYGTWNLYAGTLKGEKLSQIKHGDIDLPAGTALSSEYNGNNNGNNGNNNNGNNNGNGNGNKHASKANKESFTLDPRLTAP
jgi:type II secretory pathway pseudopilin PulG